MNLEEFKNSIFEKLDKIRPSHFECEDDYWYSCPKSDDEDDGCDCGADETNKQIDELKELLELFIENHKEFV